MIKFNFGEGKGELFEPQANAVLDSIRFTE